MKQVVVTVFVVVAVQLLLHLEVHVYAMRWLVSRFAPWGEALLLPRLFPDGLLSIGALLVIKRYLTERISRAYEQAKQALLWMH